MQKTIHNNPDVATAFKVYPEQVREKLLTIRRWLYEIAAENTEVGEIEETLKWQSPSYLTHRPRSGTTVRLAWLSSTESRYAISVHCQTRLLSEFKVAYPELNYDGNRSILLDAKEPIPEKAVRHFLLLAMTYHQRKKS